MNHITEDIKVEAQEFNEFAQEPVEISDEENKRLRRKINTRILPLLCLCYVTQALDKSTLATSSIMGWITDVHAVGQDYALTSTLLWAGIIVGEPVTNQLVRRLPVAKLLGVSMVLWSVLLLGLTFSLSIPPVFAIRFLLGFAESVFGPCLLTLTVQWYRVDEQAFTSSIWQSMLGFAGAVAALLGYAFAHIIGKPSGLHGWQWMSLAISIFSFVSSVIVLLFLPDTPKQARWATEEEKIKVVERVRVNNQAIKEKHWKTYQAWEAAADPFTYCIFFIAFFNTLVVGGLGTFQSLLINQAFGFDTLTSQLLSIPTSTMIILLMMLLAWLVTKTKETLLCMIGYCIINIAMTVVVIIVPPTATTRGGLLVAFYLLQCFQSCNPQIFSLLSRNSAGQSKKSITYAVTYIGWAGGNAVAPQLFQSKWAPRYITSLEIHLGIYGAFIITCLLTRFLLVSRNKKKIAAQTNAEGEVVNEHLHAFEDLTDKENPDFRYSL